MPKRLEEAFKRSARKRGIEEGSERWNAYVYGGVAKAEKERGHDHHDGEARESSDR